ncbi:hypothetical protein B296_00001062 [Ensete ventricosum]|uniref:Uncharacterized protein n=1 Tax=Ensete ventricosum TaxID=4639 RepID=A0A427BAV3_ENSVE|nr:hypothetical protein B296_00001062 [Ensete ventricosum]
MEQLGLLGATTRVLLGTLGFLQKTQRESKIRLKYRRSHSKEERVRHHAERRSRFLGHGRRRWLGRSERREQQLGGLKRKRAYISLTASLSSPRKGRADRCGDGCL